MEKILLDLLACPVCKSSLYFIKADKELVCKPCRLAYPIKDDIPVMLESLARRLNLEEIESIKD